MGTKAAPSHRAATQQGTHDYFEKVSVPPEVNHGPRILGKTGWITSALGFGCYRVSTTHPDHRKSMEQALKHGVNLIDTSTNYGDGDSERLVGSVLEKGTADGWLRRDEVILVSKVGYVQGSNLAEAVEKATAGTPYSDMVQYTDDCWHCIHPEFLAAQLDRSLRRLGVECIDVYLLHNPEYFFSAAMHQKQRPDTATLRKEFYRRIEEAFAFLEEARKQGKIQYYGVSSNTLGKPEEDPESTSIETFVECAKKASGSEDNGFAVVQMPLNLFESDPVFTKVKSHDDQNVLEFAKSQNIAVLINRPLNGFFKGQLIRLADFPKGVITSPFKQCLSNVQDLEQEFQTTFLSQLSLGENAPEALFAWGTELAQIANTGLGVEHWNQIEAQVRWQTHGLMVAIEEQTSMEGWKEWRTRYSRRLEELLQSCLAIARQTSNQTSQRLIDRLKPQLPDSYEGAPLSQKAIASVLSTEGVTTVLVGMRRPEYVKDALDALNLEYVPNSENAYKAFKEDFAK